MGNVWAVFRFELRQAMSFQRMLWWAFLIAFPIGLTTLVRSIPRTLPREPWSMFLFALLPMMVSMLGTFLWTAPAVSMELERQSWIYLAVRPRGRIAVLFGKYLAAVCWTLPAAIISATICILIASGEMNVSSAMNDVKPTAAIELWWALIRLILFACPAYAAVYLLLGTIFTKRSMVIAVLYTLLFELAVSFVPAVVNKLTIQFRLRALLIDWADIELPNDANSAFLSTELFGDSAASTHQIVLICYTLVVLYMALFIVRAREYTANAADA